MKRTVIALLLPTLAFGQLPVRPLQYDTNNYELRWERSTVNPTNFWHVNSVALLSDIAPGTFTTNMLGAYLEWTGTKANVTGLTDSAVFKTYTNAAATRDWVQAQQYVNGAIAEYVIVQFGATVCSNGINTAMDLAGVLEGNTNMVDLANDFVHATDTGMVTAYATIQSGDLDAGNVQKLGWFWNGLAVHGGVQGNLLNSQIGAAADTQPFLGGQLGPWYNTSSTNRGTFWLYNGNGASMTTTVSDATIGIFTRWR